MKILICVLLTFRFIQGACAQAPIDNRTELMRVRGLELDGQQKLYRLHLAGKAGAYFAPKSLIDCLEHSVKKQEQVELTFNVSSLHVSACKINP